MVDDARTALGLSIGATNLAAVTADVAITRKPVLTLYRQRPPEVGVPSENPRLDEPGLVVSDFVDRVGDPVGPVAADGSAHRSEALVANGLRALAYAATGGRPLPEGVAVTYPAHWSAQSVDAMGAALGRVSEWSNCTRPLLLIPDAAATLTAVRASPGMPARGTVAVCDFGGSGTSITLMNAAGEPVAPTVRHHDFSGDMIDQAVLSAVIANLSTTIGSLNRLRSGCRSAKEQLSSSTVTAVGDIRLTRNELDDAIRGALNNFVAALDETLRHNGIRDLAAVVAVGGGANIPAVTTTLSGRLGVPVVTAPRPHLAAAIGGSLRAAQEPGDNGATVLIPAAAPTVEVSTSSATAALPWPRGHADSDAVPVAAAAGKPKRPVAFWRRLPTVAVVGAAVALLLAGAAVAIGLASGDKPATAPTPAVAPAVRPPAPPSAETSPPATADTPSPSAPPESPAAPAPAARAPAAPAAKPAAPRLPAIPRIPELPALPDLPSIPGINAPIPGLPEIPPLFSEFAPH
jgi:molecular chaperone DnaK (HSP70)